MKLYIIAGPTACGKTDVGIELAKRINGQIISADSIQIYKGMDIGSAKIKPDQMQGIRHYLIDELMPDQPYSIAQFKQRGQAAIEQIKAAQKQPILVGGTGFYIQSLVKDVDFTKQPIDSTIRQQVEQYYQEQGQAALYSWLQRIDPASCDKIHRNNVKRVKRAIEFYLETGTPISRHNQVTAGQNGPYQTYFFVLNMERQLLYQRIEQRVDRMIAAGLVQEVQALLDNGYTAQMTSMQGIGYKEMVEHLTGQLTLEQAIAKIKTNTRHFAKRQITWFKRESNAIWLDVEAYDFDPVQIVEQIMKQQASNQKRE